MWNLVSVVTYTACYGVLTLLEDLFRCGCSSGERDQGDESGGDGGEGVHFVCCKSVC